MTDLMGKRMRASRKAAGLSQDDIAIACDVRRLTVASWETGSTVPRANQLDAFCRATGTTLDWIVRGEGPGPELPPDATTSRADAT